MKKRDDVFIPLDSYSVTLNEEYLKEVAEYKENTDKFGEGSWDKPIPPKPFYAKKYFNTSVYRIDSWYSNWDKEEQCEIIGIQWTNLDADFVENITIKMSSKQFLEILHLFGGRVIEYSLQGNAAITSNHTGTNSTTTSYNEQNINS